MLALVVALSLGGAQADAASILPLLAGEGVSEKQAHGVTALVRKAIDDGHVAKLLSETKGDNGDAQRCQREPKCLGALASVRGADLMVAGAVTVAPDGLRISLVVVKAGAAAVFRHAEATLQGKDGDDGRIDCLVRVALDPSSLKGTIVITGDEGAAASLDGRPLGALPLDPIEGVPEGDHILVVAKDGYRALRRRVSVLHGTTTEVKAVLLAGVDGPAAPAASGEGGGADHTEAIVLGSIGAGLFVLGGVAGALSLKDSLDVENRAKAQLLAFPQDSDLTLRGQVYAYTADGLYAAGLVAAGAAAALWFLSGDDDAEAAP